MDLAGKKVVVTYGTFDLFHVGHVNLLRRLKELGDYLIVGVSTDSFNKEKDKKSFFGYEQRAEIVASVKYVDMVIPENSWAQKKQDVKKYNVDIFGIGDDWRGRFDELKADCEVVYLTRTEGVSSTEVKRLVGILSGSHLSDVKSAIDLLSSVANSFE